MTSDLLELEDLDLVGKLPNSRGRREAKTDASYPEVEILSRLR